MPKGIGYGGGGTGLKVKPNLWDSLNSFGSTTSPELYGPLTTDFNLFNSNNSGNSGTGFGAQGGLGLQAPDSFLNMGGGSNALPKDNWFKSSGFLGGKNTDGSSFDGWGGTALNAGQGLLSAFMGMKQYGLAKKTLSHNKDVFERNFAAQKSVTNDTLQRRQQSRISRDPQGGHESVVDYMNRVGVK